MNTNSNAVEAKDAKFSALTDNDDARRHLEQERADYKQSIEKINEREHLLATVVCDSIWGGEHAWENASDEEFKSLVKAARKRLSSHASTNTSPDGLAE